MSTVFFRTPDSIASVISAAMQAHGSALSSEYTADEARKAFLYATVAQNDPDRLHEQIDESSVEEARKAQLHAFIDEVMCTQHYNPFADCKECWDSHGNFVGGGGTGIDLNAFDNYGL